MIRDDGILVEMRSRPFESEDLLQNLLATHPSLIAGDAVDPTNPRRWLLVSREQAVPGQEGGPGRWSLDHLFLDQDGVPTLVEVKRASDTRGRREVVAQMLDYAANGVVYWPIETIRLQYERTCAAGERDADEMLREHIERPEADLEEFWRNVDVNLRAGRIRMVFIADVIYPELRRIIEFLNAQMSPAEVIALEIKHYVGQGLRTLVPRLVGRTAEAERRKGPISGPAPPRPRLTFDGWLTELTAIRGHEEAKAARIIAGWWRERGCEVVVYDQVQSPYLRIKLPHRQSFCWPATLRLDGKIATALWCLTTIAPFDAVDERSQVVENLRQAFGQHYGMRAFNGEPAVPLVLLLEPADRQKLLAIWQTMLDRISAGH